MSYNPVVLYVEDEPMSRTVMEYLLKRGLGFENVTIFEDSQDFITRVEDMESMPDVVFLDIHVPPHDGFEMLTMLREHPHFKHLRVIALTASVMNEEVQMLKNAGFDGGIAKPIDQKAFPKLLEQILDGEEVWSIT